MTRNTASIALAALALAACSSPQPSLVHADAAVRAPLFAPLAALEGEWVLEGDADPPMVSEFVVSSGGHVVREIMMKGTPNEMTNVYQLDGNSVALWHFCAAGNTPVMRADGLDGDRMAFELVDVVDLKSADDHYMGGLTLVWVDDDTIEQHWSTMAEDGVDHELVMRFHRR